MSSTADELVFERKAVANTIAEMAAGGHSVWAVTLIRVRAKIVPLAANSQRFAMPDLHGERCRRFLFEEEHRLADFSRSAHARAFGRSRQTVKIVTSFYEPPFTTAHEKKKNHHASCSCCWVWWAERRLIQSTVDLPGRRPYALSPSPATGATRRRSGGGAADAGAILRRLSGRTVSCLDKLRRGTNPPPRRTVDRKSGSARNLFHRFRSERHRQPARPDRFITVTRKAVEDYWQPRSLGTRRSHAEVASKPGRATHHQGADGGNRRNLTGD